MQVKGNVRKVEADLIEAKTIIAEEIQVERAKIDALSAIAITTENLSAQTISASQITTGTLNCANLTVTNLSANSINSGIMSAVRIADSSGAASQTAWYYLSPVTGVGLINWVTVRKADGGTVDVPTGMSAVKTNLYVLKGSTVTTS